MKDALFRLVLIYSDHDKPYDESEVMLENLSLYDDVKRNALCPCGSGKVFKKCCMKEYREAKKRGEGGAKVSSFTPLMPLQQYEKDLFTKSYQKVLTFSHQFRYESEIVYVDDYEQTVVEFMAEERAYFYEHSDAVIQAYRDKHSVSEEESLILDALRQGRLETFFVLSYSNDSAVITDTEQALYNIMALHSSFTELFKTDAKYFAIKSALIPYKNRYILDGIFSTFSINREIKKALDTIPYSNPQVHYQKDPTMMVLPLLLTFSFICDTEHFEAMETILLKGIPHAFSKSMLALFDEERTYKKYLVSAFLRSTDLAAEFDDEEGDKTFSMIIGGLPTMSFETGNDSEVIDYETLERLYQQKPLSQSASRNIYEKVMESKSSLLSRSAHLSSYYTMMGMVYLDGEEIEKFERYLEICDTKAFREKMTIGLENLYGELSDKAGFEITPVFLGAGIELDTIYDEIESYRTWHKENDPVSIKDLRGYSNEKR